VNTVNSLWPDFPVFGSIIEVNECLTRLIGPENHLLWLGMEPERMAAVVAQIGRFYLECAQAQIAAAAGKLDGFVIWGDMAYKCGTFMNPAFWREHYKPWVKAIVEHCHRQGLMVIYHGCGNVQAVMDDFVDIGVDAYNPLEVKAGMDAVDLRRRLGHSIGFCGNSDVMVWEKGDKAAIRREVLRKLNAAKGGGYIFQSDHSVASDVSGQTYDMIVKLVREFGKYPLALGAFDETMP
jgi:uroporphyrinogen-III decarboxylase